MISDERRHQIREFELMLDQPCLNSATSLKGRPLPVIGRIDMDETGHLQIKGPALEINTIGHRKKGELSI